MRETFVAVITTNIPMLFPHVKKWLGPIVSAVGSSLGLSRAQKSTVKTDSIFSNITSLDTWRRRSRRSSRHLSGNTVVNDVHNESQEDMIGAMGLQEFLERSRVDKTDTRSYTSELDGLGIQRQVEISVLAEKVAAKGPQTNLRSGNYTSTWSAQQGRKPSEERSEFFLDHVHQQSYDRV